MVYSIGSRRTTINQGCHTYDGWPWNLSPANWLPDTLPRVMYVKMSCLLVTGEAIPWTMLVICIYRKRI